MTSKPARRPSDPRFSPGPTRKRPGWTAEKIAGAAGLGRSHRAPESIARMNYATKLIGEILGVPADYRIANLPGLVRP